MLDPLGASNFEAESSEPATASSTKRRTTETQHIQTALERCTKQVPGEEELEEEEEGPLVGSKGDGIR